LNECLVIGRSNVGKTAFVLSFAEYLGLGKVSITFHYPDGFSTKQDFRLDAARRELIGHGPHTTRCLQALELEIRAGKSRKKVLMTDSSGFSDGIPSDEAIRKAIAQTLLQIKDAALILHMLDASAPGAIGEVDRQIARYSETRQGYVILANKMDLPTAENGFRRIKAQFPNHLVLPISALQKKGFKEVKAVVASSL
jgi:predicted GTPase